MQKLVVEEIMSKAEITALGDNRDFKDAVNKALKNNRDADKELEKKVRKIVAFFSVDYGRGIIFGQD